MRREVHEKLLDFVAALTSERELVKMLAKRSRACGLNYDEVDARLPTCKRRCPATASGARDSVRPISMARFPPKSSRNCWPRRQRSECKLSSARMNEIKIDEVLQFCERMLCNVPTLWKGCSFDQQQRLQQVLFPWKFHMIKNSLPNTRSLLTSQRLRRRTRGQSSFGSANGNRTHVSALRGPRPNP
jgi:hypothetical protein